MKRLFIIFILVIISWNIKCQEKYAVLIVGDYAAKISDIPVEDLWNGNESSKSNNSNPMIELIDDYLENNKFHKLHELCKSIVNLYPETIQAENALKLLFNIEKYVDNDYMSLKTYYLSDSIIQSKYTLSHLANYLANKCNEEIGNWQEVIDWYQNTMNDSKSSYNDSLFASIDLGYLYQKLGVGNKCDWQSSTDLSLLSLPNKEKHNTIETFWSNIVTSQPEGFTITDDGKVSISTGEGLAWLISCVNGLNGQEASDYKDIIIKLEKDIDISGNYWLAIGNKENPFRGVFDGQGYSINGINMYDAYRGENFGLFGYIDNAVIKNLILDKGQIVGYENCGAIAYMADNNSIIDRCIVKIIMDFANHSGGVVGINQDSKIINCAMIATEFGASMEGIGGIAGKNISKKTDAIIENCFVLSKFIASYSTYYSGGIVGENVTKNENSKAIIRNCYASPLDYFYGGCGGIVGFNSENSLIENSYYTIPSYSNNYILYYKNEGDVINCSLFMEDLSFENNIEVFDNEVGGLLEALNKWVDNYPNSQYLTWIIEKDINNGYPILSNMKNVTVITETSKSDISIYPNPASDFVKISADSGQLSNVKIYNSLGMLVEEKEVNASEVEINISDYNSGIYFIEADGVVRKIAVK
ncbi:MAG: T9SS type A sorting domain-containing protein [Acholeplasmatales bacterium]|nr:T9SS type A sorting domain-containing protein [Acholeplasmatales bacterium]